MNNYKGIGNRVTVAAPAAQNAGDFVLVSKMFGIAETTAVSAAALVLQLGGVVSLAKANAVSTSAAIGDFAYWDATNSQVTISASSNTKIGVFVPNSDANETYTGPANTDTVCYVRLNGAF